MPRRSKDRVRPEPEAGRSSSAGSENLSFEAAVAELESIVRRLEGGEAELEESLALFERGVALARLCAARLAEADARIRMLVEAEDGAVSEVPFSPDEREVTPS